MFYDDLFTPLLDTLTAIDGVEYAGLCFAPPDNLENLVHGHLPACRLWLDRLEWLPNLSGTGLEGQATVAVAVVANPARTGQAAFLLMLEAVATALHQMTTPGGHYWQLRSEQTFGAQGVLGHVLRFTSAVER